MNVGHPLTLKSKRTLPQFNRYDHSHVGKIFDCRLFPSEKNCTLAISGTEEEVLDLAVLPAVTVHGHTKTPELREQIRSR